MGTQARLVPVLALLPLLAMACSESGEEASVPVRSKTPPKVSVQATDHPPAPTTDVPMGPGFEVLQDDGVGSTPQGGPEMPPEFDLAALLRAAERESEPEPSGPELPQLPADPPAYLVGVIRMRGQTVFLELEGTASQLATALLPMRRACQSFEMVGSELHWTVPASLNATFGEQDSMVPAALTLTTDPTVHGAVTLLSGDGGGLDANVLGWLRALKRPTPTANRLTAFLRRQERFLSVGGLDVVIVDLSGPVE